MMPPIIISQSLREFGLRPRVMRRILWPTVAGSRSQRKRKVNSLLRLGYKTPPVDLADEIKRDFQLTVLRRPKVRQRHRKAKPANAQRAPIDETLDYVLAHPDEITAENF